MAQLRKEWKHARQVRHVVERIWIFPLKSCEKKKHRLGLGIVNTTIYNLGIYIIMDDMDEQMHNENSWLYDHRSNLDGSRLIIP